jgi:predicted outer membrane repeat protein
VLGGGFAPSPSPPPLAPPAPPGVVVLDPKAVDNTMLVYTVDSAASLAAALTAANSRHCTLPCSTLTLTADIAISETLRVNNSMVIVGACAAAPCKLDGGGDKQIMKITGLYGYVDFNSLQFVNGKQNSASTGVFGGAVEVSNLGKALFTDCKFSGNTAGQGGAVAVYAGSSANFTRCEFVENSAQNVGGAISVGGGVSSVDQCTFIGNSAGQGGGAISMDGSDTMYIQSSTFQQSEAGYGWGPDVYLRYSTLSHLYISPPDTDVGVEPVGAVQTFYAPPSPPAPPPAPTPM